MLGCCARSPGCAEGCSKDKDADYAKAFGAERSESQQKMNERGSED